ncbi:MAG TPA: hypothetical protein VJW51_09505 [Candidatus Acidoferrales bacterium]|nr:hypothetical protein [Candidatus Acidoferrales bacterium]
MRRSMIFALALLFFPRLASGQTAPADSQTLQSLLAEVRQMRQELHTTTVAVQRAQILVYRVQTQDAAVARAFQRLDAARLKLSQVQSERRGLAAAIKRLEDTAEHSENPTERKEAEDTLGRVKERLENLGTQEQEAQAGETEATDQLRLEQAKLAELQAQLDRLDKALEDSGRQPVAVPR